MSCRTCRFAQHSSEREELAEDWFECHRYPPAWSKLSDRVSIMRWPHVKGAEGCGEFQVEEGK